MKTKPTAAQPTTDTPDVLRGMPGGTASPEELKSVFRQQPGGVTVVTADAGDGPVALTATSVSSVSTEPPLLLFSVSSTSSSAATILGAETVIVHLLDADHLELAQLAATSGVDRFADTSAWTRLVTGEPAYHSARAWIRGRIVNTLGAGNATVVVVHMLQATTGASTSDSPSPLVYWNREWHALAPSSRL